MERLRCGPTAVGLIKKISHSFFGCSLSEPRAGYADGNHCVVEFMNADGLSQVGPRDAREGYKP